MEYRFLDVPGVADLTGRGICYGSAVSEAFLYRGSELFVIGSGNSAAQAAVYFAKLARQVTLLVRGDSLDHSMSHYLIRQVEAVPNLVVRFHTELAAAEGTDRLEALVLRDRGTGTENGTGRWPGHPDRAKAVHRLGGRPTRARRTRFHRHWP